MGLVEAADAAQARAKLVALEAQNPPVNGTRDAQQVIGLHPNIALPELVCECDDERAVKW